MAHHEHSIDNFDFVAASKVKTDPKFMWRVRIMQIVVGAGVIAIVVRGAQMAGLTISLG